MLVPAVGGRSGAFDLVTLSANSDEALPWVAAMLYFFLLGFAAAPAGAVELLAGRREKRPLRDFLVASLALVVAFAWLWPATAEIRYFVSVGKTGSLQKTLAAMSERGPVEHEDTRQIGIAFGLIAVPLALSALSRLRGLGLGFQILLGAVASGLVAPIVHACQNTLESEGPYLVFVASFGAALPLLSRVEEWLDRRWRARREAPRPTSTTSSA
jgi:hypothetical protein